MGQDGLVRQAETSGERQGKAVAGSLDWRGAAATLVAGDRLGCFECWNAEDIAMSLTSEQNLL